MIKLEIFKNQSFSLQYQNVQGRIKNETLQHNDK